MPYPVFSAVVTGGVTLISRSTPGLGDFVQYTENVIIVSKQKGLRFEISPILVG